MIPTRVVFLEASDEVLLRRFSETRRPHPLGTDSPVKSALKQERRHLRAIRRFADFVIDTSKFNVHELRSHINERFQKQSSDKSILVSCVSFGFRQGVPEDSDLVFDVRFLPNPHFVPEFRPLTGRDPQGRALHPIISANPRIHFADFQAPDLSSSPLHSRGQELSDHRLRVHRRTAPLRHDGRGSRQASTKCRISRQSRPPRQPKLASNTHDHAALSACARANEKELARTECAMEDPAGLPHTALPDGSVHGRRSHVSYGLIPPQRRLQRSHESRDARPPGTRSDLASQSSRHGSYPGR